MKKKIVVLLVFVLAVFFVGQLDGRQRGRKAEARDRDWGLNARPSIWQIDAMDGVFWEAMCQENGYNLAGPWWLSCPECNAIHVVSTPTGSLMTNFSFISPGLDNPGIYCIPCGYAVGVDWGMGGGRT